MSTADADDPRHADPPGGSTAPVDARGAPTPRASAPDSRPDRAGIRGCPFLVAEGGGYRLGTPSREHRCGAFNPPASLAPEKQSRLCLTPAHTGCATYVASLDARTERLGSVPVRRATRWGLARTTSVIEDAGGVRSRVRGMVVNRRRWPAVPAVILITTLLVLAIAGLRPGAPATAVSTPTPGAATQLPGSASSLGAPVDGSPGATASSASDGPSTTPLPTTSGPTTNPEASFRTYRVKSGDTLGAIAGKFGTTVSALVDLNHLPDAGRLSIGQVLLIP